MRSKINSVQGATELVGGVTSLARRLKVSAPTVHQWLTGVRRVPTERAIEIESVTQGRVRVEALRPDVPWHVIRGTAIDSGTEDLPPTL